MNADEWAEIVSLHRDGASVSAIARRLSMSRNTVRRALTFDAPPGDRRPRKGSSADRYRQEVERLLAEDPALTAGDVQRAIGWTGSRSTLNDLMRRIRAEAPVTRRPSTETNGLMATSEFAVPVYSTSFVGRVGEVSEIRTLLGSTRLLTITGPGGVGKTRLASEVGQQVGRMFPDGVRFIELASMRTNTLLSQQVFDALGMSAHELSGRTLEEGIVDHLRHKQMLLVLDNCEHVIEATARFAYHLLRYTRSVRVLVTSREVLSVPDEQVFALRPLPADTLHSTAIELFENRAQGVVKDFRLTGDARRAAGEICSRLDGMPLAIELACARLRGLSVVDLAELLDRRLEILALSRRAAIPARHRSLQATFDWSYDLCTPTERLLWARMSVFADDFDLQTMQSICTDEQLPAGDVLGAVMGLTEKSVLQQHSSAGAVRYRMLETVRQFGADKLPVDIADELNSRMVLWCRSLIADAKAKWTGPEQTGAALRIKSNRANIRSALLTVALGCEESARHGAPPPTDAAPAVDLICTWFLWAAGLSVREHGMWLQRFLDAIEWRPEQSARLLATFGLVLTMQGDQDRADVHLARAAQIASEIGDIRTEAFAKQTHGLSTYLAGDFERAELLFAEASQCYEAIPDQLDLYWTMHVEMGMYYSSTADADSAERHFDLVYQHARRNGEKWMLSYSMYGLGMVALLRSDLGRARELAIESLSLNKHFSDTMGATLATDLLSWVEVTSGEVQRAAVLLGASSQMWSTIGAQLYGSQHWIERRAQFESSARAELGDEIFEQAFRRGSEMTVAETVAFGLDSSTFMSESAPGPAADVTDPAATYGDEIAPAFGLSSRETEIARMIARGLSNREIATTLIISPRTVEGHVSRILRKLSVRRRSQVSAVVAGQLTIG